MKITRSLMGMPVTIQISEAWPDRAPVTQYPNIPITQLKQDIEKVFDYFKYVDERYSPFKETSEVGKYNRNEDTSDEFKSLLGMAEETKKQSNGYFDIRKPNGKIDPSGIVKGWAIRNAADILRHAGYKKFYVDAGGDAEIVGKNWKWGIRNPFNVNEIIKVLGLSNCGIATSGTYERGQHIYNPITKSAVITDIVSITVIGPNVYEVDRFATATFAMGRAGINFIESLPGLEGYMIDKDGVAAMTSGFQKYEMGR